MIAVIDYRAGNIASVKKALDYLRADAVVTRDPNVVSPCGQNYSAWRRPLFIDSYPRTRWAACRYSAQNRKRSALSRCLRRDAVDV